MIKLLLVEDDTNLAFIEKSTLEDIVGGYEVMTASNEKMVSRLGRNSRQMLSSRI